MDNFQKFRQEQVADDLVDELRKQKEFLETGNDNKRLMTSARGTRVPGPNYGGVSYIDNVKGRPQVSIISMLAFVELMDFYGIIDFHGNYLLKCQNSHPLLCISFHLQLQFLSCTEWGNDTIYILYRVFTQIHIGCLPYKLLYDKN